MDDRATVKMEIDNSLPTMIGVESSNVESVGYKHTENELYVEFKNKSVYKYTEVPVVEYNNILTADSVGCYLNKQIKPKYAYKKVK